MTRLAGVGAALLFACGGSENAKKPAPSAPAAKPAVHARSGAPQAPVAPPPKVKTAVPASGCSPAAAGLVCIPGGSFLRGSNKHWRRERPEARVTVSTFYIDAKEVTNPDFERCVRSGLCQRPRAFRRYRSFIGADQPAVPVSWFNALKICLMLGKRLPTEAEWEKAARTPDGRLFPWGNERPTCRRAHFKRCRPKITKAVGSLPANPYGLYDMAGNGYEWVYDWASRCYGGCKRECGAACRGPDPRGPCQGILRCPGHRRRVLRGGSWYWPENHMRTSWRRAEHPKSGGHRLSVRCATRRPHPTPRTKAEVRAILGDLRTKPIPLTW